MKTVAMCCVASFVVLSVMATCWARKAASSGNWLGHWLRDGLCGRRTGSQQSQVEQVLKTEEEQFAKTLERGLALLDEELEKLQGDTLDGETAFRLYDTFGFPADLTADVCRERNLKD